MIPKIVAFALSITVLSVSIPVYLYFSAPPTTQVSTIPDSDNDGVPDDIDFFVQGNGGVVIRVDHFVGSCGNWLGPCKPEFSVTVDEDFDGDFDLRQSGQPIVGNDLANPYVGVFDIPDAQHKIRFQLEIVDTDGNDHIDWTNDTGSQWGYFEIPLPTHPQYWQQRGSVVALASVSLSLEVVRLQPDGSLP